MSEQINYFSFSTLNLFRAMRLRLAQCTHTVIDTFRDQVLDDKHATVDRCTRASN